MINNDWILFFSCVALWIILTIGVIVRLQGIGWIANKIEWLKNLFRKKS